MDPSQMSDEELTTAINGDQPQGNQPEETLNEEAPVASPQEETPKEDAPKQPETVAEEAVAAAEPEQVEAPAPSRREQLRVADLLKKYGPPEQKPTEPLSFRDKIDADEEVLKTLDDTANTYAQGQYNAGLEQAKSIQFHTRLEIDAPRVETKYPKLDPNSDSFQPEAADDLNQLYLNVVGYDPKTDRVANPNIRYADFVDAYMGNVNRLASEQAAESTKHIAKQAAQTGLRPDGSAAKGMDLSKHPSEMSVEELNAAISAAPRDSRGRFTAR